MKQILSDHDRNQLNERIAGMEKRTKTQIVLAVIHRSDSYAEIPWKAFAFGASVTGLVFFILSLVLNYWISQAIVITVLLSTLFAGAALALITVMIPSFARLFLSSHRAEAEVRQYAESLFLSRELFATGNRVGILLLVSLFERQVILLPDKGLSNRLTVEKMQNVITPMTLILKHKKVSKAMEEGLTQLSMILEATEQGGSVNKNENELPNEIIEEKGV